MLPNKVITLQILDTDLVIQNLIDQLATQSYAINDAIFEESMTATLQKYCLQLFDNNQLKKAAVGLQNQKKVVNEIRGDYISWVQDWAALPELEKYKAFIDGLMPKLHQALFMQCKSFEAHLAVYPPNTFYKKHMDQHERSRHRQLSCLYYLGDWNKGDGGELKIFLENGQERIIEPLKGRFVCFLSALVPHEVLLTHKKRIALTGWIRDDEVLII